MRLVHEVKDKPGVFEVKWTWLPYFLAADAELVRAVDEKLNESFSGAPPSEELMDEIHGTVIDVIMDKYPIPGLSWYLSAIKEVQE